MSLKHDNQEAAAIIRRVIDMLLLAPPGGAPSADLRRACGSLKVTAEQRVANNTIAEPLSECFELARLAGADLTDMDHVRRHLTTVEKPVSLIAVLVAQTCVMLCLASEALIISSIKFTSRQDVVLVQERMREAFAHAAETAANWEESQAYMNIASLGGAVTFYLYDRARPLPSMIRFQFAQPGPTLVYAYRLYDSASRADELRKENKVVHPAFARRTGVALSA